MSYIVVVNPAILGSAGIPVGPSFVATVAAAVFGCTLMGLYANRPFAVAPYMGENAFIAFTVCGQLGYKWQTALAAIFIAGALFVLLTLLRLRQWVVEAVPVSLRYSFAGHRLVSYLHWFEPDRDRGSGSARRAGAGRSSHLCACAQHCVEISAGFVLYPLCKLAAGQIKQVKPALFVLTALSLLFFVFYPYG